MEQAKAYATKLSEITEIPCISYENIKDIKDYEQIIYFGGLYAGGVKGLKNTFRLLKNSNIKTILVTIGLADVNNKENTNNIKASLEKQLEKDIYKNSLIFHLRGGIDYSKLNFKQQDYDENVIYIDMIFFCVFFLKILRRFLHPESVQEKQPDHFLYTVK